jgi:hypothetical protein
MRTMIAVIALVLGVLASGCMLKEVTERDLIGKYRAELPGGGVENLELLSGGDCTQEIRLPDGMSYKARGTWKYLPASKYLHVRGVRAALTPTREVNPKLADPPSDELFATPVSRSMSGSLTIMLHEGVDYRRL